MPQIDALRGAIDDALRRLSPKSAMAKALAYGRKRWDALTRYTEEGMAEIDNNIAERAIRSIAIGRKNWLRSEEHKSELQSLMRISYAVFCLKTQNIKKI